MSTSYLPANAAGERRWATSRPRRPQWRRILPAWRPRPALLLPGPGCTNIGQSAGTCCRRGEQYVTADFGSTVGSHRGASLREANRRWHRPCAKGRYPRNDGPARGLHRGRHRQRSPGDGRRTNCRGAPLPLDRARGQGLRRRRLRCRRHRGPSQSESPWGLRVHGFPQFSFRASWPRSQECIAMAPPDPHRRRTTVRIDLEGPASSMDWLLGLPAARHGGQPQTRRRSTRGGGKGRPIDLHAPNGGSCGEGGVMEQRLAAAAAGGHGRLLPPHGGGRGSHARAA